MLRLVSLLAALAFSAAAFTQTVPTTNPAIQQVQLLAPQLLALAGSAANFESLVNGLTQGTPVTLTTVGADGTVQVVTFTTATALTAGDTARLLETARQSLIARGIATPTAQQLAISLMGGALPTALGPTPVVGLVTGSAGATPVQVRTELAAPSGAVAGLSAASLQALQQGFARNTSVTIAGASGPVTFNAPGRAMSAFEVAQALQLAGFTLAQQGILAPTAEQLRAALLGGTVTAASGPVTLQGVLQGQVRNISDSPLTGTSNSTVTGTSNTSSPGTSNTPPAASAATPTPTPSGMILPGAAGAPGGGAAIGGSAPAPRFGAAAR
jgi:hypothetical protein